MGNIKTLFYNISKGYSKFFRTAGFAVLIISICVLISLIIVYPLWYIAIHYTSVYTFLFFAAAGIFIAYMLIKRILNGITSNGSVFSFLKKDIVPALFRIGTLAGFLILLYAIIILYAAALFWAAIPLTVMFLLAFGYVLYLKSGLAKAF